MEVTIPCPCPNKPHETDTIWLADKLDEHQGLVIQKSTAFIETTDPRVRPAEMLALMSEMYVLLGTQRWTLRDEKGKPLPVSHETIRSAILENPSVSWRVIEAADRLYNEAVLLPLVERASNSSPDTPTETSTSPRRTGGRQRRPKPSTPSSITTIPTDDTAATSSSLDGVSSSSQSSESAA